MEKMSTLEEVRGLKRRLERTGKTSVLSSAVYDMAGLDGERLSRDLGGASVLVDMGRRPKIPLENIFYCYFIIVIYLSWNTRYSIM